MKFARLECKGCPQQCKKTVLHFAKDEKEGRHYVIFVADNETTEELYDSIPKERQGDISYVSGNDICSAYCNPFIKDCKLEPMTVRDTVIRSIGNKSKSKSKESIVPSSLIER